MNFNINEKSGHAEGFCMIKSAEKKTTAKGIVYLDLILSDASGEIPGKIWDYTESAFGEYVCGDIVKIRGLISQYNGADQIKLDRIRKSVQADNVNVEDFVPSSEYSGERMFNELRSTADEFKDKDISSIVIYLLDKYKDKLLYWPAAFKLHHAMRGGLLYHTLSIVKLAQNLCSIYPFVDKDLLVAGAILHDIAKTDEFEVTSFGVASGYTNEGNLIGHLAKGAILIEAAAKEINTPDNIKILLQHMVLSHHGEPEFGAAVRPQFIEAELLSELDMMDARIYEMAEAVYATDEGTFSNRVWALDNRKLFNHGRMTGEQTVNLFD